MIRKLDLAKDVNEAVRCGQTAKEWLEIALSELPAIESPEYRPWVKNARNCILDAMDFVAEEQGILFEVARILARPGWEMALDRGKGGSR